MTDQGMARPLPTEDGQLDVAGIVDLYDALGDQNLYMPNDALQHLGVNRGDLLISDSTDDTASVV